MPVDAADFRRLIELHQRMVYSIALRITGEPGTAEEVAQDVFLELHRTAQTLSGEDHIRFWLRRVAVHRATDALRRRALRPEAAAEEWNDECHAFDSAAPTGTGLQVRLEDLMRAVPEPLRVVIVLRYQEEMLPVEIAELLNQPVATVKSHLQRGLKLLRGKAAIMMKEYVRETA